MHELDSLAKLSISKPPDKALDLEQKRMQLAKKYGIISEQVRAYCSMSYIMGQVQMDFAKGKLMADSAAMLVEKTNRKDLLPSVNLSYSVLHKFDDSSFLYMQKTMSGFDHLNTGEKIQALITIANNYSRRGSYKTAEPYYQQSLQLARTTPHNPKVKIAIYNNLAVNYKKMRDTLQALTYWREGYKLITDSIDKTGEGEYTYSNLGQCFFETGNIDSAILLFNKYVAVIKKNYPGHLQILPNVFLAEIALLKKDYKQAAALLSAFGKYIDSIGTVSPALPSVTHVELYYRALVQLKKAEGNLPETIEALEKQKNYTDFLARKKEEDQVVQYERQQEKIKSEIAIAQKDKIYADNKLFFYSAIFSLLLLLIIAINIAVIFRNKKRKEERRLMEQAQVNLIEKKELLLQAETTERRRIAQELHDELGSAITVIGMVAKNLKYQHDKSLSESIEILQRNSSKLTEQVNEIVWSLNDDNDTLENLLAFVYRHTQQFLTDTGIKYILEIPEKTNLLIIEGYKRRYIFHSIKESLNNVVKHSGATVVELKIKIVQGSLLINLHDNGNGMNSIISRERGNGILNIQRNIKAIGGYVEWAQNNGTEVIIKVPLE